jgi:hypothetical protein
VAETAEDWGTACRALSRHRLMQLGPGAKRLVTGVGDLVYHRLKTFN